MLTIKDGSIFTRFLDSDGKLENRFITRSVCEIIIPVILIQFIVLLSAIDAIE